MKTDMQETAFNRHIHLLYVPTLACNLACRYCYLGDQTGLQSLKQDSSRASATLRHALQCFAEAGVLPFNVSLHGGEPTMLPPAVLDELFTIIRRHYLDNYDELNALGFRKSYPHIKTNLFNFHKLYDLFDHHRVSISASIDLPLALHGKYRTNRQGKSWIRQTMENLRLLGRYPHGTKISTTLYREHLEDIPALIADIWRIHSEIGLNMNSFNIMFGFESALNRAGLSNTGSDALCQVSEKMQLELYESLKKEFTGTELEEGFLRNWFDEFKPSYCTNSFNCGERFFLLQSDGEVWSCVRGQGIEECHYGNILRDPTELVFETAQRKISLLHQRAGLAESCQICNHLHICHTGCPVVKHHTGSGKSYTCALQKAIYRDNPRSWPPASDPEEQRKMFMEYAVAMHPALAFADSSIASAAEAKQIFLPNDLYQEKNTLQELIAGDAILRGLYSDNGVVVEINGETDELRSQILNPRRTLYTIVQGDSVVIHLKRSFFDLNCEETLRNTLYLQMLRDTPVVYGDEKRSKQEHLFTYQIFHNLLKTSTLSDDFLMADITGLLHLHRDMFIKGVLNNLFVTTGFLREYHYQKQKANAFYHIQAINLPFHNFEFYLDE